MRLGAARVIAVAVAVLLVFTLTETLAGGSSLTKEEVIEISRNSPLVQKSFENSDRYAIEVHPPDEGHDTWEVSWYIHVRGDPSAAAIGVTQNIDGKTGEIVAEGSIGLR